VHRILPVLLLVGLSAASIPDDAEAKKKYRCRGRIATIVGTKHADRIAGTRKKDVIVGLGGAEKDEVLDWEGPNMTQEPNCFSANPCPP
jgi:hypothetical protein